MKVWFRDILQFFFFVFICTYIHIWCNKELGLEDDYNEESDQDWEEEEEDSDADSIESLLAHPALFRDDDSLVDIDNVDEEEVQKRK